MVKNSPADAGDKGSIPDPGRFPREENGNPLQYSCLGNPVDRGAWRAAVHEVAESDMTERARSHTRTHTHTNNKRTKIYKGMIKVNFRIVVTSKVKEREGRKEKRAVFFFFLCKIFS